MSLEFAFKIIGCRTLGSGGHYSFFFLYLIRRIHSQASSARYKISALKEPQRVLKTLFAVLGQNLRVWRKQNPAESDEVIFAHLNAGSCHLKLEDGEDVVILRTDVTVPAEWRDGDGVGVEDGRIVTVASVNDSDSSISWRKPTREDWNKCTCKYHLE